jgi:TRAP-type C4-dicarboxylate transport system substrate-binding protein
MKTEKQQTAVEWFQEQIIEIVNGRCELSEIQIFEQAKEMENEQIIDAYRVGKIESTMPNEINTTGGQYYNETYESK